MTVSSAKKFLTDHLKTILAAIALATGAVATYADIYAQVKTNKVDVQNIKDEMDRKDKLDAEFRTEFRRTNRDLKSEIEKTNSKLDKLIEIKLQEMVRDGQQRR